MIGAEAIAIHWRLQTRRLYQADKLFEDQELWRYIKLQCVLLFAGVGVVKQMSRERGMIGDL